jgi:histidyl-tRNA synthetase
MEISMLQKIRGTQDILDMSLYNYIVTTVAKHLRCYGFNEITTPLLEPVELFKRSLGLHTDVVSKEMFIVASRDEEKDSIALRPEATASTMRAFLEHHHALTTPWKVFSTGPMFRYERPQKGRFRQFHQINIEVINSGSVAQDAYALAMLDRLFQNTFKLENYALTLNFLGCPSDRLAFKEMLYSFLNNNDAVICFTCKERKEKNILRIFDCKTASCQDLYRTAPHIADTLCAECSHEWADLKTYLDMMAISYSYVPTLVRGLDYYDKTAFEFVSANLGAQTAFCGGGRYNHLASVLGSDQDYPSFGAAIGVERLMLLLESHADTAKMQQQNAIQIIVPMESAQHALALLLADELHAAGICTDILFEGSLKSMMRKAQKLGADHVLILGEQEQAHGTVTVKNMVTADQATIKQTELIRYLTA